MDYDFMIELFSEEYYETTNNDPDYEYEEIVLVTTESE